MMEYFQDYQPNTFPLRIIGNTQVHPETVDPVHSWLIYQVKTNNHSNKRNPLTFTRKHFNQNLSITTLFAHIFRNSSKEANSKEKNSRRKFFD